MKVKYFDTMGVNYHTDTSIKDGMQYALYKAENFYSDLKRLTSLEFLFKFMFANNWRGSRKLSYLTAGNQKLYYNNGYIYTQDLQTGDIIRRTKL